MPEWAVAVPKCGIVDGKLRTRRVRLERKMQSAKTFCFGSGEGAVYVRINEVVDPSYGLYVWPCAVVLAQFVWHNRKSFRGKRILEIGAGTALPGIIAAKCGARVTLSDAAFLPHCLELCCRNVKENGLCPNNVDVIGLSWGSFSPLLFSLRDVEVVLGSDCFYDPAEFEGVLATVSYLMSWNPIAKFWCTYQERSADWSIEFLLSKWDLECKHIPLSAFGADSSEIAESQLPGPHTIHMMEITKNH